MKQKERDLLIKVVVISIIVGFLAGGIAAFSIEEFSETSTGELMKEFYEIENAVHISPHGLRKHIGEDPNVIIVDLRSQEEYEEEHIVTAVNVPAYKDRDHSDYGAIERIVSQFKELHDTLALQYFNALFKSGVRVAQLRTMLGILGFETKGPERAAEALF